MGKRGQGMTILEACKLVGKYDKCPKCGCEVVGNGKGTLEIDGDIFKRTCHCGWSIIIDKRCAEKSIYIDSTNIRKQISDNKNDVRSSSTEYMIGYLMALSVVEDMIDDTPTADVVEVRHGEWIKQKPDVEAIHKFHDMGLAKGISANSIYWVCSICGNWGTPTHKYCCSCGAKMDARREENER